MKSIIQSIKIHFKILLSLVCLFLCNNIYAQNWPSRPIKLIIPYAAGGPTDILGRVIAQPLSVELGVQVIVENRPGVGAIIGSAAVASATPDGYTILLGDINLAVNPSLYKSLPYDFKTGFIPVSMVAVAPLVLVVKADTPYTSLDALITTARKNPGKLTFGSAGAGNTTHLIPELLKASQNLDITHIPYKGAGPAVTDLASGQIDFVISGLSGVQSLIQAGKLRALAITGDRRSALLPQVSTFSEAGYPLPEVKLGSWWGVLLPQQTPQPIVSQMHAAIVKAMATADVKNRLQVQNIESMTSSPDVFLDWINSESDRWSKILQRAKVQKE